VKHKKIAHDHYTCDLINRFKVSINYIYINKHDWFININIYIKECYRNYFILSYSQKYPLIFLSAIFIYSGFT